MLLKNIVHKVIRNIELKGYPKTNKVKYIENDKNVEKYKHSVNDSELLRIVEAIDSQNVFIETYGNRKLKYVAGIISLNIRYNIPKYEVSKENEGILILEHWQWVNVNEDKTDDEGEPLKPKYELLQCFDDDKNKIPTVERFKRLIVGSSHTRGKKALFVREDLFEKVNTILLGGIDQYREINGYPYYKKGYAKWSSYYGLPSTDSKAVNYVPNIVVVDDFKRKVVDTFDTVIQTKSINPNWKDGDDEKDKYIKKYDVKSNDNREFNPDGGGIMPFDGAGLVSVECAKVWSNELEIKNKYDNAYIPAAFQIRAIPGIKGNLYTFDIKTFAEENGWIITDIKGKKHDLCGESVDIILTVSQAKFIGLFDNDITLWREVFDKPVVFYKKNENGENTDEIECSYKRTFNISEYSDDVCDLKKQMLTAYQHLLTVDLDENDIEPFIEKTINMFKNISCDVNEFLRFRSCTADGEQGRKKDWERIPPYYRAAYYASDENKPIIFADDYFKRKVKADIDGIRNRILSGKLYITGNYQVLTPDIYGLAQYAFGKRGDEVTGLLNSEEIYSNWWIYQNNRASKKETDKDEFICDELALIRNPHIYMEARTAKMVSPDNKDRYDLIRKWFIYQTTGIVTDSYSTIPLALGTADFDGDHIATTNSKEYIKAVNKARKEGKGNTVDIQYVDNTHEKDQCEKELPDVTDIKKLMEFDVLAYRNNIGSVIDRVSNLWGIAQTKENCQKIRKYIEIMDIVGQLTIDAAKTGEFEPIPNDIERFLRANKILKPYFMKYLQKNEQRLKNELDGIENAEFFECGDDVVNNQLKFSNDDVNLNRICHKLEESILDVDIKVVENEFDIEKFLKIFLTQKPSETSELYINLRDKLGELIEESNTIYKQLSDCDYSDESKAKRLSHYQYFYINARSELLNICRLSQEKSINKVLNCIVYMCYREPEFMDNDSAKNILWNCFEEEMIERAKGNYSDNDIDLSGIAEKIDKTRKLKSNKLAKYQKKRQFHIVELENKNKEYSPIIVREADLKRIYDVVSDEELQKNKISIKHKEELQKLYGVLMVISKYMESDRPVGKQKVMHHFVNPITIHDNRNNGLNFSNIAKLCSYSEYQRKNLKSRLKELYMLNAIEIKQNEMHNIKFTVLYDVINPKDYDSSLVDMENYESACYEIILELCKNEKNEKVS